jgi:hypothetical protein
MDPTLKEDPEEALTDALNFFTQPIDLFKISDGGVTFTVDAKLYSWYVLNEDFAWSLIEGDAATIHNSLNFPLKCELRSVNSNDPRVPKNPSVLVPEFDHGYHVYAELSGFATEGGLLSVRCPLSASIIWRDTSDDSVLKENSLVLALPTTTVGHAIACEITPKSGSVTKLVTEPVKPGEFRFRSLRLQGHLVENDDVEFDVSTSGTRAVFKGIRILRSARHGEWENVTSLNADQELRYKLTVQDIGCVIRAVCVTEGGGPPLMLTSSERVDPSPPHFANGSIFGAMRVGMPIFVIAQYEGGIQGACRYDWSVGGTKNRPVAIPGNGDVGKVVSCIATPIRNDGSIGPPITINAPRPIAAGRAMNERYLTFHKKTRSGKLQMSFVDQPATDQLHSIQEGDTVILSSAVDWVVVDARGIKPVGNSKSFSAQPGHVNGIIVIFNEDFFALVGQITAAAPTALSVQVSCDRNAGFLNAAYEYLGGIEGRSIVQWNRTVAGSKETVIGFTRSQHITVADRGAVYRAIVTPVALDGRRGVPGSSDPFLVEDDCVTAEDGPHWEFTPPESINENIPIRVVVAGATPPAPSGTTATSPLTTPLESIVTMDSPLTKRTKLCWIVKPSQRVIADGPVLTPTPPDVGKIFTIQVRDRIRDSVLAEIDLPAVSSQPFNIELVLDKNSVRARGYRFFTENQSTFVWRARRKVDGPPQELGRTFTDFVSIDASLAGVFIDVVYTGSHGGHVVSRPLEIPRPQTVSIESAELVLSKDFSKLCCRAKANDPSAELQYHWGYDVDGQQVWTENTQRSRPLVAADFSDAPFCSVRTVSADGEPGEEAVVYPNTPLADLVVPVLSSASIAPVSKGGEIAIGHPLRVKFEVEGPEGKAVVKWQRPKVGGGWKTFADTEAYTPVADDAGKPLRAVVEYEIVESARFPFAAKAAPVATEPIVVGQANPNVITRFAGTLKRAGRAQFEASLQMGEQVLACFENGFLIIKNGPNVLLRTQIGAFQVEQVSEAGSAVVVRARHGYNTELTFGEKKMAGGTRLAPEQTRELFIATLAAFTPKK